MTGESRPLPYRRLGSLRFQLALLVLLWHGLELNDLAGPWVAATGFGPLAVLVFFVLSGFIVTEAALSYYGGRPAAFLGNRVIRLWPPHLVALCLSALVLLATETAPGAYALGNLLANALALFPTVVLIDPLLGADPRIDLLPVVWALRAEFLFYLSVAAVLLCGRWLPRRLAGRLLLTTLAAALLGSLISYHLWFISPRVVFYGGLTPHFVLGAALALRLAGRLSTPSAWAIVAIALPLATLHALTFQLGSHGTLAWSEPPSWAGLAGAGLYLLLLLLAWRRFSRPVAGLALARDRYLGDLSYPIYLLHWPALVAVGIIWSAPHWSNILVGLVLSLLLAGTMHLLLDPLLKGWRRRLRRVSLP